MEAPWTRCKHCRRQLMMRFDTDRAGHVVEETEFCGCAKSRRLAGICRHCPAPVDGPRLRTHFCAAHREQAKREYHGKWNRSPKGREKLARENARRRTDEVRAQKRIWSREYRERPEVKERLRLRRRKIALKHPERKREQHRRYREKHPDRVAEQQRRANEKRKETKRLHMHRYATKYVGLGKSPRCRDCNADVPFNGRGRPHVRCESCDPKSWRRDQTQKRRAA